MDVIHHSLEPDAVAAYKTQFIKVRAETEKLAAHLSDADLTIQSMPDASPGKWHLAHTTWFFETFLLKVHVAGYQVFNPKYDYLFNSYYNVIGDRHARPRRGMLSRPSIDEILSYRTYVNDAVLSLLDKTDDMSIISLVELGLNHEQQHQELFQTDILHALWQNPLRPAYYNKTPMPCDNAPQKWLTFDNANATIGANRDGFAFDCECPAHTVTLYPFQMAHRMVTNAGWLAFIEDEGYTNPLLWLSDGFDVSQKQNWCAPLYWFKEDGQWFQYTLHGVHPIDPNKSVTHVSYYEADAYATWAGARLPAESEWEHAANQSSEQFKDMYGTAWQWTNSSFSPYPGFKPNAGAVGEYNGKFMCGQFVLRGSSCVTPAGHSRHSYRNFFHPEKRWQFSGVRLAKDGN